MEKYIQLGLCCHVLSLRYNENIFTGRTIRLNTIKDKGIDKLIEIAMKNLDDLQIILHWCLDHGIYVFRMSSDLIPHASNLKLYDILDKKTCDDYFMLKPFVNKLKEIGNSIKNTNLRITFHPGQYNQVGTPNKDVFLKTKIDLQMHALILNIMDCSKDSIIIVHGGGTFGDKPKTIERWKEQFNELPEIVKKYLVIENDETCYSANDALEIANKCNIPFILDVFHHECYNKYKPEDKQMRVDIAIKKSVELWIKHNKKPKFHLSEQGKGNIIGSHSTIVKTIPYYFFDFIEKYKIPIDIMIEAKGKEVALAYLYNKYEFLKTEGKLLLPDKIPYKAKNDIRIDDEEYLCAK